MRQRLICEVLQVAQGFARGHAGHGYALDGGGVELLEMVQRFRRGFRGDVHDGGQWYRGAAGGADVVIQQLVRVQAIALLHLWDHHVGAPGQAEVVDVAAAEHRGQGIADVLHVQSEQCGLVAVDLHRGLGQVDAQVRVQEHEHAALLGLGQEILRYLVQTPERLGGADDELDR